jgi:hypothetical protein
MIAKRAYPGDPPGSPLIALGWVPTRQTGGLPPCAILVRMVENAVREAVAEMTWLTPADGAVVEIALVLGRQVDAEIADGDAVSLNVSRCMPHLLTALRTLDARRPAAVPVPNRLTELRAGYRERQVS